MLRSFSLKILIGLLFVFVSLLSLSPAFAEPLAGSPEWLVEAFSIKRGFPDKEKYYTGEMREHLLDAPTLGENLPPEEGVKSSYRVLEEIDKRVVFAINYEYEGEGVDYYCYIVKEGEGEKGAWKISAVRRLALPELYYLTLDRLREEKSPTVQEVWVRESMKLVTDTDESLKRYFLNNVYKFDELRKYFNKYPELMIVKSNHEENAGEIERSAVEPASIKKMQSVIKSLYLNFVQRDIKGGKTLDFNVGGLADNSVGFLHIPDGERVPRMNPARYIYIERIIHEWYIYKTT